MQFFPFFNVINVEDFLCAFFFDFFCVHFWHFLLRPIVDVDISDIAIISVIPDMVKAIISGITNTSKNLSYCPINRFLESFQPLLECCGSHTSELRVVGIYGYTPARHVVAGPGTC